MIENRHPRGPRSRLALALLSVAVLAFLVGAPVAQAAKPSVTINQAAGQADPTSGSQIQFTVIFSQSVTGFTAADISLSASTAGGTLIPVVTGGPAIYTVTITGMSSGGNVVASIPAGAAQNSSNESNLASTSTDHTVTWIEVHPSVTIDQAAAQTDPTSVSPVQFTATFSEPVTGFTAADISLSASTAGGTLIPVVTGGPAVYTVSISGMTSAGNVVASIPAGAAQNASSESSLGSTSTDHSVGWIPPHPSVTINQAVNQSDPTAGSQIQFTATFSEVVTGFTAADVDLAGSTAGGTLIVNVSGGPAVYTVTVTGMTGVGTVVASIPAGAAVNSSSLTSLASTSTDHTVTWDPSTPSGTGSGGETGSGGSGGGGSGGGSSGGGSPTPTVAPAPTPSLTLLSTCSAKHPCATDRRGKTLRLRIACSAAAPCIGLATIVLKHKTLGKATVKLAAGATTTLRVPLTSKAAHLLASKPKLTAKLDVVLGSTSTAFPLAFGLPVATSVHLNRP